MRTPSRALTVGLIVAADLAVAAALGAHAGGLLDGVESHAVAARFDVRGEQRPRDIAVVAVDDVTFSELRQQWPFPRSLHGKMIDRLRQAGVRQIVYDVQFTEPTRPREDLALYEAIGRARNVVLATTESDDKGRTAVLGGEKNLRAVGARAAASNLPDRFAGVLDRFPHTVGPLRSLAVVTAERLGTKVDAADFESGDALIDFRGGPGTIPTFSFSRVLDGTADLRALRGRVVVVGASAPSLQDVHPTPASTEPMSGPEVQGNAIWTVLHGFPLRHAGPTFDVGLIVLLALLPPLLRLRIRILRTTIAAVLALGLFAVAAQLAFQQGTVVLVAAPLLALVVSTLTTAVASHLVESAERRRVMRDNSVLEEKVHERTAKLRATQLQILQRLGQAAEWRDGETGAHISRIGVLSEQVALDLGLGHQEAEMLRHASAAHDLGKIGIPDRILLKPGPLTDAERAEMQTHALMGANLLDGSDSPLLQQAEEIARTHHEKWDGTGYPHGLAGEDIPLTGRICALCDVFDALVSERPYKRPWPLEEALAEISSQRGRHFDPDLVDPFIAVARRVFDDLYGHDEPLLRAVA